MPAGPRPPGEPAGRAGTDRGRENVRGAGGAARPRRRSRSGPRSSSAPPLPAKVAGTPRGSIGPSGARRGHHGPAEPAGTRGTVAPRRHASPRDRPVVSGRGGSASPGDTGGHLRGPSPREGSGAPSPPGITPRVSAVRPGLRCPGRSRSCRPARRGLHGAHTGTGPAPLHLSGGRCLPLRYGPASRSGAGSAGRPRRQPRTRVCSPGAAPRARSARSRPHRAPRAAPRPRAASGTGRGKRRHLPRAVPAAATAGRPRAGAPRPQGPAGSAAGASPAGSGPTGRAGGGRRRPPGPGLRATWRGVEPSRAPVPPRILRWDPPAEPAPPGPRVAHLPRGLCRPPAAPWGRAESRVGREPGRPRPLPAPPCPAPARPLPASLPGRAAPIPRPRR